jgi:uncharacterized protein (DUF2132 family)
MDKHGFRETQKKLKLTNEGISETMDVELFTVQQWASGNWPIPKAMVKFLRTLLSARRDMEAVYMSGFHRGRNDGHKRAQLDDFTRGYDEGYREGLDVEQRSSEKTGYDKGYGEGFDVGYDHGGIDNM